MEEPESSIPGQPGWTDPARSFCVSSTRSSGIGAERPESTTCKLMRRIIRGASRSNGMASQCISAASVGGGCNANCARIGLDRRRLSAVSRVKPLVVDTHRIELGLYRQHAHHHVLDHRGG